MDSIPDELILHTASFLEVSDIFKLQLSSRRFHNITRDNELWRWLCIRDSNYPPKSSIHPGSSGDNPLPIPEPGVFDLQRAVSRAAGVSSGGSAEYLSLLNDPNHVESSIANDDAQNVNWCNEYVARKAPLSIGWLQTRRDETPPNLEVRGIGLLKSDNELKLVSPLDDGSICLWDVGDSDQSSESARAGYIQSRSNPGVYGGYGLSRRRPSSDIIEGVSIDSTRQKAYIASRSDLTEIDLSTYQATVVFQARQIRQDLMLSNLSDDICTLSAGGASTHPLTIGTSHALYLFDPRLDNSRCSAQSTANLEAGLSALKGSDGMYVDQATGLPTERDFSIQWTNLEPLPLSIVHHPQGVHVGGRFPFILNYDWRSFPRLTSPMYSGARTSSIAALPTTGEYPSLVAAGEYKGKGSLEIYPSPWRAGSFVPEPVRNRTSASSSKLLSVIPHGNRILFSDSDGRLKWVERDGSTLVRRWNINDMSVLDIPLARRGIFNATPDDGDVARKLLSLGDSERSEICVWTGERVGILNHGKTPRLGCSRESDMSASEGESDGDDAPQHVQGIRFERMMRRALERQANEVRFVPALGLGR